MIVKNASIRKPDMIENVGKLEDTNQLKPKRTSEEAS